MFRHEKVFALERNCIVGQKSYNKPFFSFLIRNFVTPIIESVRKPARITPYPTGRLFCGGAVPGTSCQATIAPSLRDISQQALAGRRLSWLGAQRFRRSGLDAVPAAGPLTSHFSHQCAPAAAPALVFLQSQIVADPTKRITPSARKHSLYAITYEFV